MTIITNYKSSMLEFYTGRGKTAQKHTLAPGGFVEIEDGEYKELKSNHAGFSGMLEKGLLVASSSGRDVKENQLIDKSSDKKSMKVEDNPEITKNVKTENVQFDLDKADGPKGGKRTK